MVNIWLTVIVLLQRLAICFIGGGGNGPGFPGLSVIDAALSDDDVVHFLPYPNPLFIHH